MFSIDNYKDSYELSLDDKPYNEHNLIIKSERNDGKQLPWGVDMVSDRNVIVKPYGVNGLKIILDFEKLDKECFIILRNYAKEKIRIIIKPNWYVLHPREYKFKITRTSIEGKKMKIKILSKEGENELGWECTYDGKPLNYSIEPFENNKSSYVYINLKDELFTNVTSMIEFTQNKSEKKIKLNLEQNNDEIKILKAD